MAFVLVISQLIFTLHLCFWNGLAVDYLYLLHQSGSMWDKIIYILYKVMLIIVGYYYWFRYAILVGSYYLVYSGYPIGASFLPPHKATQYHTQEFRRSSRQLASGKELFNYRHSSLHMVIERAFGVLKARFPILSCMANYKQYHQRLVVSTCCVLHNFIRINNRRDVMFNT